MTAARLASVTSSVLRKGYADPIADSPASSLWGNQSLRQGRILIDINQSWVTSTQTARGRR